MSAPLLAANVRYDRDLAASIREERGPGSTFELFRVVQEGTFRGVSYAVGDVLVCSGEARSSQAVVLVARGHGRPRLGTVQGPRLIGDAGEPCLEARWRATGRLVAVARRGPVGWVVLAAESAGQVSQIHPMQIHPMLRRSDGRSVAQLWLFGAVAA